jgi:Anti-sigma factor NepR
VRKPTKVSSRLNDNNETKSPPTLGSEAMAVIGRELRRMYADIVAEGVPERFAEILRRLDEPSNGSTHKSAQRESGVRLHYGGEED